MPSQTKPNVNTVWASAGLASPVDAAKQALGWIAEIPEYDDFNGMIQQISQFQKHVNQEGVPAWDALTQYYTNGFAKANGTVYIALQDTLNNAPPAIGATNAYWRDLFARVKDFATDTGAANAYVGVYAPTLTLADGLVVGLKAVNTNTGASTFNGTAIVGLGHAALQGGEIIAGGLLALKYNSSIGGGSWVLVSNSGGALPVAPATKSNHAVQVSQLFNGLKGLQKFTSGNTFVVPVGVTSLYASGSGGGGGGGGSGAVSGITSSWSSSGGGGGGDAGVSTIRQSFTVTPGQTLTIAIGAAGTGGAAGASGGNGGNGGNGGATTITGTGVSITLAGGAGGFGGAGINAANNVAGAGGSPGGASAQGGASGMAVTGYGYNFGGPGGSGGSTPFGSGGGGKATITATVGAAASGNGGGGAGACGTVTSSALLGAAGGVGAAGVLFLEW